MTDNRIKFIIREAITIHIYLPHVPSELLFFSPNGSHFFNHFINYQLVSVVFENKIEVFNSNNQI